MERKGVEFNLVNVEDLIALKTASDRLQDRVDISKLRKVGLKWMERKTKVEPVVRMLPATPETFEILEDEMLEYSASLSYSERLDELDELKMMWLEGPMPSAKVYRGFRRLTDPDPFDD